MGYLLMLCCTLVVFFIIKSFWGTIEAATLSGVFLVGWALFNIRAATHGLVKSNLRAYFVSRSRGATREQALAEVIRSRYPFSQNKQEMVKAMFGGIPPAESRGEKGDLSFLVYTIFRYETGRRSTERQDEKIIRKIDDLYDSMTNEYKVGS
jgi:hypothetical protein